MLKRIPIVRGVLNKWRIHSARKKLLASYSFMMQSVRETPVKKIHFDNNGCVYSLEDGRAFSFSPDKSAGWLYSVPFSGLFEEKETEFVRRTVQEDWVCLDIGACFGWYSVLLSRLVGKGGEVHAFEPVPDNRECLQNNLALNGCTNVEVNPFGLGDQPMTTQIYVPVDGVSGSLRAHAKLAKCRVVQVDISTVDHYVTSQGLGRLDFIKADIEGAELLMLKGAQDALQKYKPILMLEIQSSSTRLFDYEPKEIFNMLHSLGYRAHYVRGNHHLVRCEELFESGARLPDYNFIFIPEESSIL